MTIRFLFRCTRCGSKFFRPSSKHAFANLLLRKIGITAQRCFQCRQRFYLYRPAVIESLMRALADPSPEVSEGAALHPEKAKVAVHSNVVWNAMPKPDPREGGS
jgi:hypothetical protein